MPLRTFREAIAETRRLPLTLGAGADTATKAAAWESIYAERKYNTAFDYRLIGHYDVQLAMWRAAFPPSQILVVEDFFAPPQAALAR